MIWFSHNLLRIKFLSWEAADSINLKIAFDEEGMLMWARDFKYCKMFTFIHHDSYLRGPVRDSSDFTWKILYSF